MPGLVIGGSGHYVGEGWIGSGDAAGAGGISAVVNVTDAADALVATAQLEVRGAAALQDAGDALAAAGALALAAAGALADAGDQLVATAKLAIGAVGDDPHDLDPGDVVPDIDDAPDALVATAALEIRGLAALQDATDALAATAELEGGEPEPEPEPAPALPSWPAGGGRARRILPKLRPATSIWDRPAKPQRAALQARAALLDDDDALAAAAIVRDTPRSIGRRQALEFLLLS